ncbi:flagellin, partial [Stenotrophomonas maltophilia]|nr:flagellin [Stenotrophomonas maltophilia]MCU1096982.1 flagellin [Stenotrophomonas maltophilia]MCU1207263.1 flagellin [Stenotrophomonas maltophilia]
EALDAEVKQLTSEIDRVARQTNFNGTNLLDGTFSGALFQVGADSGQTIGISSVVNARTSSLGSGLFAATQTSDAAVVADAAESDGKITGMEINGVAIADVSFKAGATASDINNGIVNAINDKMDQTGVYAKLD